jgi:hypothetical protein
VPLAHADLFHNARRNVSRCADCGTPIIYEREGGERTLIAAGTLDDRTIIKPSVNLFCASAQAWVPITPDTQNLPGYFT